MKASIELELKTREVYQLFERRINGDRLFIEAILRKFNIVMNQRNIQKPAPLETYQRIEQRLHESIQQLTNEITRFEALLAKRKFGGQKINYITQFRPTVVVSNPLAMLLVRFIVTYDKLVAVIKLLRLAGCFETDEIYFGNIQRHQKIANQILSDFAVMPLAKLSSDSFRTKLSTGIVNNYNQSLSSKFT